MIKKVIPVLAISTMLISCDETINGPANRKGAEKICECMEKKSKERADLTDDFQKEYIDLDYSLCALDGVFEGADVMSDGYTQALNEVCPDLKEAQERYLKNGE